MLHTVPMQTPLAIAVALLLVPVIADADIIRNPGNTTPLPTDRYVQVVNESESPVQPTYIKARDGLYIAAAIRKPKGDGPFPAMVIFHGAPGGRGMDQLVGWSLGKTGGPVWERFLQEGFVVAVADYRGGDMNATSVPSTGAQPTAIDDGVSVVEYVQSLPYVDTARVSLYGVSLGGNLVLHVIAQKLEIRSAILGAPAPIWFMGMKRPEGPRTPDTFRTMKADPEVTSRNIGPIRTPVLILVGTEDGLLPLNEQLHEALAAAGKLVRMEVYEGGYHDFVLGPQGQKRPDLPQGEMLYDSALNALEKSVRFAKELR
jgi:dipeptidyl aminopeptidase/acylaminoacyl peptidase